MWCAACGLPERGALCMECRRRLHRSPDRIVGPRDAPGLLVRSAYLHDGPARRLVHELKYSGSRRAARILAEAMAPAIAPARALVPIPRSLVRRWRYGIDQAVELANALAAITGVPVTRALQPPIWQPRHAGRPREGRAPVPFRVRQTSGRSRLVLVDDVVTTGRTLWSAAALFGDSITFAVAATSAGEVTSLSCESL